MPNHVTNDIILSGSEKDILALRNLVKSEDNPFDFSRVKKIPNELVGTVSPMTIISQEDYDKQEIEIALLNEKIANGIELSKEEEFRIIYGLNRKLTKELSDEYISKFGADNWYDWNKENYGTKWNSYNHFNMDNGDEDTFSFQTAWSHPFPIIKHLSILFPELEISVKYADEDFGYNLGEYIIKDGVMISKNFPKEGSSDAFNLALEIIGGEDYYLYDIWDEVDSIEDIIKSDYYKWALALCVNNSSLDEEIPMFILELALEYANDNELYEKSKELKDIIDGVKI